MVELVGAVGKNDPYWPALVTPELQCSGVGIDHVLECEDGETGTATILVKHAAKGESRIIIIIIPGANHAGMDVERVEAVLFASTSNQHGSPHVVVMQGELPRTTTLSLLRRFSRQVNHHEKTHVAFNPAPVFREGIPLDALCGLAVLVVNELEFLQLSNGISKPQFPTDDKPTQDRLDLSEEQLETMVAEFQTDTSVFVLLVTLGARGVYYSDHVVDTTAAGDTFVGYFAASLAKHLAEARDRSLAGFDVTATVHRANSAAGLCVRRAGGDV
jgi:ribokinase